MKNDLPLFGVDLTHMTNRIVVAQQKIVDFVTMTPHFLAVNARRTLSRNDDDLMPSLSGWTIDLAAHVCRIIPTCELQVCNQPVRKYQSWSHLSSATSASASSSSQLLHLKMLSLSLSLHFLFLYPAAGKEFMSVRGQKKFPFICLRETLIGF